MAGNDEKKSGRILIVDDQPAMRARTREALERGGFEIVGEAEDGDQAVEYVRNLQPDLIIMDYVMERMDGISATRAVLDAHPRVKIIMLTQEAKPHVVMESIRAGAVNFVIKPFKEEQLLNAARKAMRT